MEAVVLIILLDLRIGEYHSDIPHIPPGACSVRGRV